jgi:hypothetical protein
MTQEETLRRPFVGVEVNEEFSEAVLEMRDGSRLRFCHRVGERWAQAVGAGQTETEPGTAGEMLAALTLFRLNAKHLEIQFRDGSRWEMRFRGPTKRP